MDSKGTWDFNRLFAALKGERAIKIIVVVGFIGIGLVLLSQLFDGGGSKAASSSVQEPTDTAAYQHELEERLEGILSGLAGVGKVDVMVTLDGSSEYVFAEGGKSSEDQSQEYTDGSLSKSERSSESESDYVLVDGPSGKSALVKTVIEPKIRGVLVVCEGAGSPLVEQRVLEAVSKVFGISTTKICVTK